MKLKSTLVFALISLVTLAQESVEKKLGDFSKVKVYDLINVKMIKSNESKIQIEGKDRNDVELVNKNGTLKIRMSPEKYFDGSGINIALYYTNIDLIDANEGSVVSVEAMIDQYEIDLKSQEGAKINADINVKYANIRAVTGGMIRTTGKAKNQDVSVYTGGVYEGEQLETEFSEVSIQAGGEIKVNCTDKLEIKIKAGGDVYVYGNPKTIDENRVFGGRVKRMD